MQFDAFHKSSCAAISSLLLVAVVGGSSGTQGSSQALPANFEEYLAAEVRPTAAERTALLAGTPVSKLLPSDQSKEVFVFGAVWVNASPLEYVRQVKDIENFEKGGAFQITKKISDPPKLEDFARLEIPDDDLKDLQQCKAGACEIKLGAKGLDVLRTQIHWGTATEKSDANMAFRRLALEYVTGYREGGNTRLAVYRDKERPTFVANEFRSMIEHAPSLVRVPDLQKYLLEYPAAQLPGSTDFLYWQEAKFGLKPTIRINHLTVQERPDKTVIASKLLYASHYFWTALEERVLQADPARGPGFWFVTISRSRSDGLNGFVGGLLRGKVRSEAQKGTEAVLKATKANLERR
jgi:hypothetical protein